MGLFAPSLWLLTIEKFDRQLRKSNKSYIINPTYSKRGTMTQDKKFVIYPIRENVKNKLFGRVLPP